MREKWKKLKFLHLGVRVQLTERKEERNQFITTTSLMITQYYQWQGKQRNKM
jgi:hypothetical protein